jgi:putative transposase
MSWDITYLPTMGRGLFFYLYLFIDLYSRKIVGWQVYESESANKAAQLEHDICIREGIKPQQATLHADNGSAI